MSRTGLYLLLAWLGTAAPVARGAFQFGDDPTTGTDPTKVSLPKKTGTLLNIRGETAVNGNSGALSFTYPLTLPQWRGLFAGIGLRYDSQAGNGPYGYGFALTLPSVELSRQFGLPRLSTPLSSDDGELVPVEVPPGMPPGQYLRSRIEGAFHLYRRDKDQVVMFDGNGVTYVFGGSPEAREEQPGLTTAWHLSSIEDASGNKVSVSYYPQAGSGVALPHAIVFVNRDGTAPVAVTFAFDDRPDPWLSYRAGIAQTFSKRLSEVAVFGNVRASASDLLNGQTQGATRISRFAVRYAPLAGSGIARRSLVTSIDRFGATDSDITPSNTFEYSTDRIAPAAVTGSYSVKDGPDFTPATAKWLDFNGDGLVDLLGFDTSANEWRVWLNQGGDQPFSSWRRLAFQSFSLNDLNHAVLDINGDRRLDLIYQDQVYLNNPSTGMWDAASSTAVGLPNATPGDQKAGVFVDMDGDSRTDYVEYIPSLDGLQLNIYRNESDGRGIRFAKPYIIDQGPLPRGTGDTVTWSDMNGDGLPDAVQSEITTESFDLYVWTNTGGPRLAGPKTMSVTPYPGNRKFRIADVNGDGYPDLIFGDHYSMDVYLGNGSGFVGANMSFPDNFYATAQMFEVADMNGNGSSDLITATTGSPIKIYDPYANHDIAAPFLLTTQSTALGEHNHYEYVASSKFYQDDEVVKGGMPALQQLLAGWRQFAPSASDTGNYQDALAKHLTYGYGRGAYDALRNEFLGYGYSEMREARKTAAGGQAGDFTQGTLVANEYYTSEEGGYLKGKVRRNSVTGLSSKVVYKTVETPFTVKRLFPGKDIFLPLLRETKTTEKEGDGTTKALTTRSCTRLFDPAMVPGDRVESTLDESGAVYRRVHTKFSPPGERWLVRKPTQLELLPSGDSGAAPLEGKIISYHATNCAVRMVQRLRRGVYETQAHYEFEDSGLITKVTDAGGAKTELEYEGGHLPTKMTTHPGPGLDLTRIFEWNNEVGGTIHRSSDENGQTTEYLYDGLGRLKSIQPPASDSPQIAFKYAWGDAKTPSKIAISSKGIARSNTTFYDGLQRAFATLAPTESQWILQGYKSFGISGLTPKESASLTIPSESMPWSLVPARLTSRIFDDLGRGVRESVPISSGVTGSYSAFGQTVAKGTRAMAYSALYVDNFDEEGVHRREVVDLFGRKVQALLYDANPSLTTKVTASYDQADRLRDLDQIDLPRRHYDYDEAGHLIQFTSSDIGRYEWDYTATDTVSAFRLIDANGAAVATRLYAYDMTNREIERRVLDGEATDFVRGWPKARMLFGFHYDQGFPGGGDDSYLKGRLAWRRIGSGAVYRYAYDARGNQTGEILMINGRAVTTATAYDDMDRVTKITYPNARSIAYAYTPGSGALVSALPIVAAIQRDELDRVKTFQFAAGVSLNYDYDAAIGSITRQKLVGRQGDLAEYNYAGFDALQRQTTFHGQDLANASDDRSFAYDSRGQLQAAKVSIQPKQGKGTAYAGAYAYGPAGLATTFGDQSVNYSRAAGGVLSSVQAADVGMAFGPLGLMASSNSIKRAVWSGGEHLACLTPASGERTWFDYQPDGSRFAEVSGSGAARRTTIFVNKIAEMVVETGGWTNHYVVDGQRVASEGPDGKLRLVVLDPQQTQMLSVYADGTMANARSQTPWGHPLVEQKMDDERRGFLDALYDRDAELHQLQTRHYAAELGLFVRPDEHFLQSPSDCLKSPLECNALGYAKNNPLAYIDPKGMYVASDGIEISGPANPDPSAGQYNTQSLYSQSQGLDVKSEGLAGVNGDFARSGAVERDFVTDVAFDTVATIGLGAAVSGMRSVVGAGASALSSALKSEAPRVFWSGGSLAKNAAKDFAQSIGGKTLEMTFTGRLLDTVTTPSNFKYLKPLWDLASANFARGALGEVTSVQAAAGVRIQSVWATIEYQILKNNGIAISYRVVP